ncbi:inactive tyrosine-protein kinase PRAG1 [Thalassophryne amazonica]|uniref:inactive tyrosine-protein kinase PRAG1 n=1 Tax=Thalassophryne amazonica TaxID=390379 RepID=UPI0014713C1B|nr:inactive tyrosine-protein kinase PRAG1 [Thalassophryne amazonica]
MASGITSREEEQPPSLPVKQHRRPFRGFSGDSDFVPLSPLGLTYNDVFNEPTDCHAAQCPIHQRYDHSLHQLRFFSAGTPPPVPKKRAARTLSLPANNAPPSSPLLPPQRPPQNYDNPLYMLAPISAGCVPEEKEVKPAFWSFSQLCFDTPDEHLPLLFSSFEDQRVVSQGIQCRHLLFLKSVVQRVEAGILLQEEVPDKDAGYQPQDFLLCEDNEAKQIGEAVYYSLCSPKFPGRVLGLRVLKLDEAAPSVCPKHQPSHVNVHSVIAHFQHNSFSQSASVTFQAKGTVVTSPSKSDCRAAEPPHGGSTESVSTVLSFLQGGHCVSIERDLPCATLEDFVEEMWGSEPAVYDRQVCFLLLQILMGSQHLHNSDTSTELRPQDIFLLWPRTGGNQTEQVASEIKEAVRGVKTRNTEQSYRLKEQTDWRKERVQMLLRTEGCPRVVLHGLSAPHSRTSFRSQVESIIQYCLDPPHSLKSQCSEGTRSQYRRGLLRLASLLMQECSGLQVADMVAMLQVLLWGPNIPLHHSCAQATVHSWLTIGRALLLMKLAEKGLIPDQPVINWDDFLCLQYLSLTDPETVMRAVNLLLLTS